MYSSGTLVSNRDCNSGPLAASPGLVGEELPPPKMFGEDRPTPPKADQAVCATKPAQKFAPRVLRRLMLGALPSRGAKKP